MNPTPRVLRDVRRGPDAGEIQFVLADGRTLIVFANGVHEDEQRRTRESLLKTLAASGLRVVPQ